MNNTLSSSKQHVPEWLNPSARPDNEAPGRGHAAEDTSLRIGDGTDRGESVKAAALVGGRRRGRGSLSAGAADRLRLLRYKATRPCCLTVFGLLHMVTVVAALLSMVSQALDVFAIYDNNR